MTASVVLHRGPEGTGGRSPLLTGARSPSRGRPAVLGRYRSAALWLDGLSAVAAALVARTARPDAVPLAASVAGVVLLPAVWLAFLGSQRAHEARFLGTGAEEYRRVGRAAFLLLVAAMVIAYLVRLDLARGVVLAAFCAISVLTVLGRHALRFRLYRRRRRGEAMHRVIVVGRADAARLVVDRLARMPEQGLEVVGICPPPGVEDGPATVAGVPVVGTFEEIRRAVGTAQADTVAVVSHPDLSGQSLRRLAWVLEEDEVDLLVVPGIVEVAGPRLSIRPIAGMSLLHLQRPATTGWRLMVKVTFDRVGAAALLVATAPLMAALATGMWLTRCRPLLVRSPRLGRQGSPFDLLTLRVASGGGGRLGAAARRLHLDEVPALVNVVRGDLSLVGPRPVVADAAGSAPSQAESVSRLLRIRPGITGPWRLADREQPSPEEALSMDLRYVDNWSVALDVLILIRTLRALVAGTLPTDAPAAAPRVLAAVDAVADRTVAAS